LSRTPLAAGAAAFLIAASLSLVRFPWPCIHDEFSHLLAADTFAHGRLANPTPPLWEHFESPHVILAPSYASKYPPGQGLVMALGRVLFGLPIVGVWLSAGLCAAAFCWMLAGWGVPKRWVWLGGLLVATHRGLLTDWAQSYWGGLVPFLGGALLFGSLPRLIRRPRAAGFWLAVGLAVLANSRPYEGLVASLCACGYILLRRRRIRLLPAATTLAPVLLANFLWMGLYNQRVTGDPFTAPYQVHERTYSVAPVFLFSPKRPEPVYRHETIRRFQLEWELGLYESQQSLGGLLKYKLGATWRAACFAWLPSLFIPLFFLRRRWRSFHTRFALAGLLIGFAGSWLSKCFMPHYLAPSMPLALLLSVQGLRRLRPPRLIHWIVAAHLAGLSMAYVFRVPPRLLEAEWRESGAPFGWLRTKLRQQLEKTGGDHLVLVRYGPKHDFHQEWVYNGADLGGSRVVWARSMGPESDRKLVEHFKGRRAWLLDVKDKDLPRLERYK